jgi:hypothetical protein
MDVLIFLGAVIALAVILFLLYLVLFGPSRIVPEDRRLVIYRNGRFHRIVGPGRVRLLPGLDEVKKEIEVRDHPIDLSIPGIFAYGLPNDFKLNLWCQVDLEKAAEGNRDRLVRLVQITDSEREHQIEILVRQAIIDQMTRLQAEIPLRPEEDNLMGKVAALAPGTDRNKQLLEGISQDLVQTLPTIGVILDEEYPIKLTQRGIPQEMVEALERMRGRQLDSEWLKKYAAELREQFPEISNAVLAQMLGSIKGVDLTSVQGFLFEQEVAENQASVRLKVPRDGPVTPNVSVNPPPAKQAKSAAVSVAEPHPQATSPHLTKQDLVVLKRVPRTDQDQRKSA